MLQVSTETVAHVILRAREVDMKVDAYDEMGSVDSDDRRSESIIEDLPGDATRQELVAFLQGLNEDEQASLIALAWIGRGTYAPEELDEAIRMAKSEHATNATRYLLSLPLLSDYLEEGLEGLNLSIEDAENAILRPA